MSSETQKPQPCLAIVMDGGIVQAVVSDGTVAQAWADFYAVDTATIDLASVVAQLNARQERQP